MERILVAWIQHQVLHHLVIRKAEELFDDQGTDAYVYRSVRLEALPEYSTRKGSSFIEEKMSSANVFAQELSRAFCSREVSPLKLSVKAICWLLFVLNDISINRLCLIDTVYHIWRLMGICVKFSRYHIRGLLTPTSL